MIRVLQITDCHLVAVGQKLIGVDTQASLEAVLAHAQDRNVPDAVLATGDLAHEPTADVYARFHETVRRVTDAPLLCLPGNHDVLAEMIRAELPLSPLVLGAPGTEWAVVPLDSHQDEIAAAAVDETDRQQTAAYLEKSADKHVLLAAHHPFVAVDCPWLDKDRIQNASDLLNWFAECSQQLRGVVFGHAHQEVVGTCAGFPVYGAPSTCFQFKPLSESFAIDDQLPGYRLLELWPDGRIATEVHRVPFDIRVELKRPPGG